jgi:hypothetical protein
LRFHVPRDREEYSPQRQALAVCCPASCRPRNQACPRIRKVLQDFDRKLRCRELPGVCAEVRIVFGVEEDIGALLLEGGLAQGDGRPGHVLRQALDGSRIGGIQLDGPIDDET